MTGVDMSKEEHIHVALAWIHTAQATLDRAELSLVGVFAYPKPENNFPQVEAMLKVAERAAGEAFFSVGDAALALQVEKANATAVDGATA